MNETHLIYMDGRVYSTLAGLIVGLERAFEKRYFMEGKYPTMKQATISAMIYHVDKPAHDLTKIINEVYGKYRPLWSEKPTPPVMADGKQRDRSPEALAAHSLELNQHKDDLKLWRKNIKDELLAQFTALTGFEK